MLTFLALLRLLQTIRSVDTPERLSHRVSTLLLLGLDCRRKIEVFFRSFKRERPRPNTLCRYESALLHTPNCLIIRQVKL